MKEMKIVHLTSAHEYNDIRIFGRECRSLAACGYRVVLVASCKQEITPLDVVDGVEIRPVPRVKPRSRRLTMTVWQVYRVALAENGDVYHFHDPELLPVGLLLHARGKRVIYDVHENEPEQIRYSQWVPRGIRRLLAFAFEQLESFAARRFVANVTANDEIYARFKGYSDRTIVLRNYPLPEELRALLNNAASDNREPLLVNFGGVSRHTATEPIIEALNRLPASLNVRMVLGGSIHCDDLLEEVASMPGWGRVEHKGKVDRDQMVSYLSRAAAALVLYCPEPNHFGVGSNRFFESMAAGVPVITPNFPNWKAMVDRIGCGITVDPSDPDDIARAMVFLLTHPAEAVAMGRRGQQAVRTELNWASEVSKLLSLYGEILSSAGKMTAPELSSPCGTASDKVMTSSLRVR